MKTLVTGGCGFIGSHLVDLLLSKGAEVTVLDNFSTGRPQNLAHQKDHPKLSVHKADIAEFDQIVDHFEGIDRVYHIAALADIVPSIQRPMDYHRSNVDGTINVLAASRQHGIKRLVYAASSSCYGIPDHYPTPETSEIRPEYPYALTKWLGEEYVLQWNKIYNMATTSCRFFNVYGPNETHKGGQRSVAVQLFEQLRATGRAKLFKPADGGPKSSAEMKRDFVWVGDCVDALLWAYAHPSITGVYNCGSGQAQSFDDVAAAVFAAMKLEPAIDYVDMPEALARSYQYFTQADMKRLKKAGFPFKPTALKDGVAQYIDAHLSRGDPHL